jgi:tRNA nucleotidyltransferase (CCA-adding enzyme)
MNYPKKLQPIFQKLISLHIKPIIVGGFVRDFFLGLSSKDIDVELYNIENFNKLQNILKKFGSVNIVGKSFGVCKLHVDNLELDFSLPRRDSKISKGHKGFKIVTNSKLTFKEASSRRDFTINAMGYDVKNNSFLDPFNGQEDIKNKVLRAVDDEKFKEDPLRVLRGVGFCARFGFEMSKELKELCKTMIQNKELEELSEQRVFEELKKIILKSKKPSVGFVLLKELSQNFYLNMSENEFEKFLNLVDTTPKTKQINKTINLIQECLKDKTYLKKLTLHVEKLKAPKPIIQGRELVEMGLKPSKEFKKILDEALKAQLNGEFTDIKEGRVWLKSFLDSY